MDRQVFAYSGVLRPAAGRARQPPARRARPRPRAHPLAVGRRRAAVLPADGGGRRPARRSTSTSRSSATARTSTSRCCGCSRGRACPTSASTCCARTSSWSRAAAWSTCWPSGAPTGCTRCSTECWEEGIVLAGSGAAAMLALRRPDADSCRTSWSPVRRRAGPAAVQQRRAPRLAAARCARRTGGWSPAASCPRRRTPPRTASGLHYVGTELAEAVDRAAECRRGTCGPTAAAAAPRSR